MQANVRVASSAPLAPAFTEAKSRHPRRPLGAHSWRVTLAEAFAVHNTVPEENGASPSAGFLELIRPLLAHSRTRLEHGLKKLCVAHPDVPLQELNAETLGWNHLGEELAGMLGRTLVLEMHVAGLQGQLVGATGQERFAAFCARLGRPVVALALFAEYPLLGRIIVEHLERWTRFRLELLDHFCADWPALRARLRPGVDPGAVKEVRGGAGDTHRGGRSVQTLRFDSGLHLVYKPRSVALDADFQALLLWLNAHGWSPAFRIIHVMDCGRHGWAEFIEPADCASPAEVARFYERQGGFVALTYALEAMDFHSENLIASGEHPVLVDLECLFHPRPQNPLDDPLSDAMADLFTQSVLRPGLLPHRVIGDGPGGADISGLGARAGQLSWRALPVFAAHGTDEMRLMRQRLVMGDTLHRPRLAGAEVRLVDYAACIAEGFTRMHDLLRARRADLLAPDGPLACFAGDEVRVLLRSTDTYGQLLEEGFHPSLLRDERERDRLFDRLRTLTPDQPHLARVEEAERADLWQGDIPFFATRADSRDLQTADDTRLPGFFAESGFGLVRRRLEQMDEADSQRQMWFVRASLATLVTEGESRKERASESLCLCAPADSTRLLEAADAIGRRLAAQATEREDRAQWIGLTLVEGRHWVVNPLGLDLHGGLPGVVLFLAALGQRTGNRQATRLARAGLTTLRQQMETHWDAVTAIGAFDGWGGIVYVLSQLGVLWAEPEWFELAERVVGRMAALIEQDEQLDIVSGAAGAVCGLLALHKAADSSLALEAAARCGEWLVRNSKPLPTGFTRGREGLACALGELSVETGQLAWRRAAETTLWPGQSPATVDTCLVRLRALRWRPEAVVELRAEVKALLTQNLPDNHSLGTGAMRDAELALQASEVLGETRWREHAARVATHALVDHKKRGWRCGTPLAVETPGLLAGLAGIGYELLRLASPERVPSVLLLEPPRLA